MLALLFVTLMFIITLVVFLAGKAQPATISKRTGRFGEASADEPNPARPALMFGALVPLLLGLIVLFFASTHTIESGKIGIVKEFGSLVGTEEEGFGIHAPYQRVAEVSVQNEKLTYEMEGGNAAVSSDSQAVNLIVEVNYRLRADNAVALYRDTGGQFIPRILDPAVFQNTKQVTAQYKAIDFAKNREKIRLEIEQAVQEEVDDHGLDILNVTLKNVGFTEALRNAIEQTVEAEQQASRARAQVAIKEAEAKQQVAAARGEAESTLVKAQAEAKSIFLQGRALKQNPQVLRLRAIEKLSSKVTVIAPENSDLVLGADALSGAVAQK